LERVGSDKSLCMTSKQAALSCISQIMAEPA
jgi:hypothetical protein